jgi:hypothetical protein
MARFGHPDDVDVNWLPVYPLHVAEAAGLVSVMLQAPNVGNARTRRAIKERIRI